MCGFVDAHFKEALFRLAAHQSVSPMRQTSLILHEVNYAFIAQKKEASTANRRRQLHAVHHTAVSPAVQPAF